MHVNVVHVTWKIGFKCMCIRVHVNSVGMGMMQVGRCVMKNGVDAELDLATARRTSGYKGEFCLGPFIFIKILSFAY